jgi:hypothetical protein
MKMFARGTSFDFVEEVCEEVENFGKFLKRNFLINW